MSGGDDDEEDVKKQERALLIAFRRGFLNFKEHVTCPIEFVSWEPALWTVMSGGADADDDDEVKN